VLLARPRAGHVTAADALTGTQPAEAVLPHPAAVGPAPEVARQAARPHGRGPARAVLRDRLRRLLQGREGVVLGHEVDDPAYTLVLELVTDVDEDDRGDELGMRGGECDRGHPAEGCADDGDPGETELREQRGERPREQ